jgi:dihydroorotate dehydrogenase electron transfer subunit
MKLSAYHIADNQIRTTRILSVKAESLTVKAFTFKDRQCGKAKPGQFLMLWIPDVDEIPLSIMSAEDDEIVGVAVKRVGEATEALHKMKAGEIIGLRGPFGNSFSLKKGKILMVGGGTGIAPLLFLTKKLRSKTTKVTFIMGAKTKEELLFINELEQLCSKKSLAATTEDGSYGIKCLATAPLESLLAKEKFDMIYTCGPEPMLRKVFGLAEEHGIGLEASLERLMRCAVGICGSCVIGRYRVCRDGPIFTARQLREVRKEFGFSKRDFDGKRIPL